MCALAQHLCPHAQWTKSLSDTNNTPTLRSAASLERCQTQWVHVVKGDPSTVSVTRWQGTQCCSLWSPPLTSILLLTVSPVSQGEATGQHPWTNNSIAISSLVVSQDMRQTRTYKGTKLQAFILSSVSVFPSVSECVCQKGYTDWMGLNDEGREGVISFLMRCQHQNSTWTAVPVHIWRACQLQDFLSLYWSAFQCDKCVLNFSLYADLPVTQF